MRLFADLYDRLDGTTSTNAKVAAMRAYFDEAPPEDAAWALYFLTGRRLKRCVGSRALRSLVLESSGLAPWLVDECYAAVGDFAETVALLVLGTDEAPEVRPLHEWVEEEILPLRGATELEVRQRIRGWWRRQPPRELFLLHKMLTGELRVGVSQTLAVRALAEHSGIGRDVLTHRLMGDFAPSAASFSALVDPDTRAADGLRPYPFCLAHPFDDDPSVLGDVSEWAAEWKWDGIRAQAVVREGEVFLWSRGEELVTDRFPEVRAAAQHLPAGTVLDGELLAFADGAPLPFSALQRRIGRKTLTRKVLRQVPVVLVAFDLLEDGGEDVRDQRWETRRARLERLVRDLDRDELRLSELVERPSFAGLEAERDRARERGVEGLMLKRRTSPYYAGRRKGDWWKWKIDPLSVDVVMTYAQPGHGRRASLLTDYGFGVWNGDELTTVAQAYSGLDDAEIDELDRWIKAHTLERRGRLRVVEPLQVFEIGFEQIRRSTRHKSGVALRFPRILRWRRDKKAEEADSLDALHALAARFDWEPPEDEAAEQLGLFDE